MPRTSRSSKAKIGSSSTAVTPSSWRYGIFSIRPANVPGCSTPAVGDIVKPRTLQLVDDRVAHRPLERLVALPVVAALVDDHGAHRRLEVVARLARVDRLPERVRVALRVRVEQHLLVVEAVAAAARARGRGRRSGSPRSRPRTYMCQKWKLRLTTGSNGIVATGCTSSCASKSSSSTPVASSEKSAKFTPPSSTVAPSGWGRPRSKVGEEVNDRAAAGSSRPRSPG